MRGSTRLDRPLAFVDLETTGLAPGVNRIAEIGVVTLDRDGHSEWETLVNPGRFENGHRTVEGVDEAAFAAAPRFEDIAADLARRLAGRLVVAHNARFDHAFLKAEFARAGLSFEAPALCTVMLSRKLYPGEAGHNLDAIMERHGLECEVRHRALPDARLLHQFWQVIGKDFSSRRLWATVDKLLAEPLLPPHLDLGLIQALPEKPGVYVMRDKEGHALRIARAANLRREVREYFRLDRISGKGAKISYQVRDIEAHVGDGELSSRLQLLALCAKEPEAGYRVGETYSLDVDPTREQVAAIVPAEELVAKGLTLYGLFDSERKAGNALLKLAKEHGLCVRILGLPLDACPKCAQATCSGKGPQQLVRTITALSSLRLQPWPYPGPVGIREGRTVHVIDRWQLVGSARTTRDVAELAQASPGGFHPGIYKLLNKALPRLPGRRVKNLA